jgi:hypothetical protein
VSSYGREARAAERSVAAVGIRRAASAAVVSFVLAILAGGCGPDAARFTDTLFAPSVDLPVLVAAGDMATADLLATVDGTVITLGDNAYEQGSAENYRECYDPTWGRFKHHTLPIPGNHEYETEGAEGYFDYFGDAAGDPSKGYYSYDLAGWHIVALNSNECLQIGGCRIVSPQVRWLKANLAANEDETCTLAYMHHPRFSSGEVHGSAPEVRLLLWEALYEAGADVVLSGHEHNNERFAPQDPGRRADPELGIREFVVGTGGKSHYEIEVPLTNSEVHNDNTYGVLKLTLHPKSYDWPFIPVEGEALTDSGRGRCH